MLLNNSIKAVLLSEVIYTSRVVFHSEHFSKSYIWFYPYLFQKLEKFALKNGFSGAGSKKDPMIIQNYIFKTEYLILKNLRQYITFKNCKFQYLIVKKCLNLKLSECESGTIELVDSTNCLLENANVLHILRLRRCKELILKDSKIRNLHLIYSRYNTFLENTIYNGINKFSGGNSFIANHLGNRLKSLLQIFPERKLHKNIIFYPSLIMLILIPIAIFFTIIGSEFKLFEMVLSIGFSIFLTLCFIYVIINDHYHYTKSLKAGMNEFK